MHYYRLLLLFFPLFICSCSTTFPQQLQNAVLKPHEMLLSTHREVLPGTNRVIVRARIFNQQTKKITEVVRGEGGQEALDYEALRKAERQAIREKFGAGDAGFDAQMDRRRSEVLPFTVQFVLGADYEKASREIAAMGATVESRFEDVAAVRTTAAIAKKIARLPSVEAIVVEQPKSNLALDMARDLEQGPLALKHAAGYGRDLLTAIWELDACINRSHPDFRNVQWQPRLNDGCDIGGGTYRYHSTMAANAFAAFRSDGTAGLFQGRMFEVDDKNTVAVDDMWTRQPQVINASFTISTFDGKRIDTEVHRRRTIHVFNGAGNQLTNGDFTTCWAFNALCVGGYLQGQTIGTFQDDLPGPSSFKNLNGRETPQIVGPYYGEKLATTYFSGAPPNYQGGSGTSFATPAVAGLAALLIANYPFDLKQQPEAVRAVLMASAQAHPLKSAGRFIPIPDANDTNDDLVGVGAPNGTRAKKIMDEHTFRYGSFLPLHAGQPGLGPIVFPAAKDERIRVVLTWDQCPDYSVTNPELSVDLDMVVEGPPDFFSIPPLGNTFHSNISHRDNWEVVEFTTQLAGSVIIYVSAPVFRPCTMSRNPQAVNFGIAWTKTPAPPPGADPGIP